MEYLRWRDKLFHAKEPAKKRLVKKNQPLSWAKVVYFHKREERKERKKKEEEEEQEEDEDSEDKRKKNKEKGEIEEADGEEEETTSGQCK